MKKILLTGGSGFVGKNIQKSYLSEIYEIYAPSSKELDLWDTEAVDDYLKSNAFEVVIHAGAKPGHRNAKDPSAIFFTNSRMFFNLVRNLNKGRFGRLLNIGSGAIYDMRHYEPKMPESFFGKYIPADEHGYNKYVAGQYIELSSADIVDLRVFGIFGPYEDYAIRFISNAICKSLFDLPITLRCDRKFDYLYIKDLMPILEQFIEQKPLYKSYNCTPDVSVSLYDLACLVRNISAKNIEIKIGNKEQGLEYSGDNHRLKNEFPSLAFTPIEQAVKELYSWYEKNKDQVNFQSLLIDK
ncbi:MAG: NAD-dependent epimerase/dehydratase family protein [Bacteroidales bacterium]